MINSIAEKEKEHAIKNNLIDPYFDFRDEYFKGDNIYYVYINEFTGTKAIIPLKIRTVYARTMIGYEENACCHLIGIDSKDNLFRNKSEAESFYKNIIIAAKYG